MSLTRHIAAELYATDGTGRVTIPGPLYVVTDTDVDELLAARLREITGRAACADQPWQPIASAPKDGRWFWAWRDTTGSSRSRMNISAFKWDSDDRGWFAGTGWWPQFPKTFTHWREMTDQPAPLTAQPSPAAKETK